MSVKKATVKDLKKAYKIAIDNKLETITIDDFVLLTAYAKYLIQYLDMMKVPDDIKLVNILVKR